MWIKGEGAMKMKMKMKVWQELTYLAIDNHIG